MYTERKCANPTCPNVFTPQFRSDTIYCCYECGSKVSAKKLREKKKLEKDSQPKPPVICGYLYCDLECPPAKGRPNKFCGKKHQQEEHARKQREKTANTLAALNIKPRKCAYSECNIMFTPKRPRDKDQKYHHRSCKAAAFKAELRKQSAELRKEVIRICPACEKEFSPKKTLKQFYCERKCREKFAKKIYSALQNCYKAFGSKKEDHSYEILGYTPKQLQEHIQNHPNWSQIDPENWHLDHIFPIKAFVENEIKDISLICCLENLQPLPGSENCSKNDDYDLFEFENWLKEKGLNVL